MSEFLLLHFQNERAMRLQVLSQTICQAVEHLTGRWVARGVEAQVTVGAVQVEAYGAHRLLLRRLLAFRRHACQFGAPGMIPVPERERLTKAVDQWRPRRASIDRSAMQSRPA